jgi:hypothetical protein
LLMVKKRNTTSSESFFKHTVYGLRFLFRCRGAMHGPFNFPLSKRCSKLPVVLLPGEVKLLLKTPELLKHRILLSLLYGIASILNSSSIISVLAIYNHLKKRFRFQINCDRIAKSRYIPVTISSSLIFTRPI